MTDKLRKSKRWDKYSNQLKSFIFDEVRVLIEKEYEEIDEEERWLQHSNVPYGVYPTGAAAAAVEAAAADESTTDVAADADAAAATAANVGSGGQEENLLMALVMSRKTLANLDEQRKSTEWDKYSNRSINEAFDKLREEWQLAGDRNNKMGKLLDRHHVRYYGYTGDMWKVSYEAQTVPASAEIAVAEIAASKQEEDAADALCAADAEPVAKRLRSNDK
ncbi:hypothetical protein PFISCL1PPCAC_5134 [Pristionchus fissidentatus]|uniref:Uncharacterized protein n=1 Tax=Pristionchus fissidentatus TaxID=1538716 RepID=A0AAV5V2M5_9BILA|nr:hypothetical protein PFISCL1PPCAC_5134 [Pristionchus fissidentatus]